MSLGCFLDIEIVSAGVVYKVVNTNLVASIGIAYKVINADFAVSAVAADLLVSAGVGCKWISLCISVLLIFVILVRA
ncbi:Uncharacterized protein HZ326_25588 [Fusarium oxysporum f. sp. albedinis]|nr:Uncharacterized protein HZ326_25588 [Fusarium oxysporum f. sp. albedinis]